MVLKNALKSLGDQFHEKYFPLAEATDECLDNNAREDVDNLLYNIFSFVP